MQQEDARDYATMRAEEHRLGGSQFARFLRLVRDAGDSVEFLENLRELIRPQKTFFGNIYTELGKNVENFIIEEVLENHEELQLNRFFDVQKIGLSWDLFGDGKREISFGITPDIFNPQTREVIELKTKCPLVGIDGKLMHAARTRTPPRDHMVQAALYAIVLGSPCFPTLFYVSPGWKEEKEAVLRVVADYYGREVKEADCQQLREFLEPIWAWIRGIEEGERTVVPAAAVLGAEQAYSLLLGVFGQSRLQGAETCLLRPFVNEEGFIREFPAEVLENFMAHKC